MLPATEPPASYDRGQCRSCRAMLLWATMTTTGRKNPLNYEPDAEKGNVRLLGHGLAEALPMAEAERIRRGPTLTDQDVPVEALYLSHFATCPKAERHRPHGGRKPR